MKSTSSATQASESRASPVQPSDSRSSPTHLTRKRELSPSDFDSDFDDFEIFASSSTTQPSDFDDEANIRNMVLRTSAEACAVKLSAKEIVRRMTAEDDEESWDEDALEGETRNAMIMALTRFSKLSQRKQRRSDRALMRTIQGRLTSLPTSSRESDPSSSPTRGTSAPAQPSAQTSAPTTPRASTSAAPSQ